MPRKKPESRVLVAVVVMVAALAGFALAAASQDISRETLPDGVEHWFRPERSRPWFFDLVEKVFNILLPDKDALPFHRSVAFLVGVSEYENLRPQLPFVKNDLVALREYTASTLKL